MVLVQLVWMIVKYILESRVMFFGTVLLPELLSSAADTLTQNVCVLRSDGNKNIGRVH